MNAGSHIWDYSNIEKSISEKGHEFIEGYIQVDYFKDTGELEIRITSPKGGERHVFNIRNVSYNIIKP